MFIFLSDPSAETLCFLYVTISIYPSWESVLENPSQHSAETQSLHRLFKVKAGTDLTVCGFHVG